MRRSQVVVVLLVSLIGWQGLMAATSAVSQDRPAGFQDFLRKGDVASLAAVIDKDPSLANRLDAQGVPPLFWAAFYGQKAVVELLLGRGPARCTFHPTARADWARTTYTGRGASMDDGRRQRTWGGGSTPNFASSIHSSHPTRAT